MTSELDKWLQGALLEHETCPRTRRPTTADCDDPLRGDTAEDILFPAEQPKVNDSLSATLRS